MRLHKLNVYIMFLSIFYRGDESYKFWNSNNYRGLLCTHFTKASDSDLRCFCFCCMAGKLHICVALHWNWAWPGKWILHSGAWQLNVKICRISCTVYASNYSFFNVGAFYAGRFICFEVSTISWEVPFRWTTCAVCFEQYG